MRLPVLVFTFLGLLAVDHDNCWAQISVGGHGGYNLDAFSENGPDEGAIFLGGQGRFHLSGMPVVLNPGFDYYLEGINDVAVFQFNGDVLFPFGVDNRVFTPYAGVGIAVTRVSFKPDEVILGNLLESEETDVGLNVVGGAEFGSGSARPFVQARITLGKHLAFVNEDGDSGPGYALLAGILFRIGT